MPLSNPTSGDPTVAPVPIEFVGNGVPTSTFWENTVARIINWLAFGMRGIATEPDGGAMEIDYSAPVWILGAPTAERYVNVRHDTGPTLLGGERVFVKRPAAGNFPYHLRNGAGAGASIVTFPALTSTGAYIYYDLASTSWKLLLPGEGATPGAQAD